MVFTALLFFACAAAAAVIYRRLPVRLRLPWLLLVGGLGFEACQLLINLALGGNYRSVDVNDVILNTAGTLIGYGLFQSFALVVRLVTDYSINPSTGLGAYLREVSKRT